MQAVLLALLSLAGFLTAYFVYGRYLRDAVFGLLPGEKVPSREKEDGIDFVPTRKGILFSHHFVSIAGLGPIMGPAIGVIWGWLPALLWVFFGTIFLGAVHDFGTLVISLRNEGRPIGELVRDLIRLRAGTLMMLIIFFLLALAMGVFDLIVAILFTDFYPVSVIPVLSLIPIAALVGWLIYRVKLAPAAATVVGVVLMFAMVEVGLKVPVSLYPLFVDSPTLGREAAVTTSELPQAAVQRLRAEGREESAQLVEGARILSVNAWIYVLLIYSFCASVLPVWCLLQPRDYLNSYQLYLGLVLLYAGMLVGRPALAAPAFHAGATHLPPVFPFLFITIACGAISGFHNLVSSGTTARQLGSVRDARFIGYGAMILEGLLAVVTILACSTAFPSREAWLERYRDYAALDSLGPTLDVFIRGAGGLLANLGIGRDLAAGFIAVVVVGFAMTTLDTGTRLMRYDIEAIGATFKIKPLKNRYLSSLLAIVAIGYFALMKIAGKPAGLSLWQLFGTSNQLLAALGLLAVAVYLFERKKKALAFAIPMWFMLAVSLLAMGLKLKEFWEKRNWPLIVTGACLLLLSLWLLVEAAILYRLFRSSRKGSPGQAAAPGTKGT